jgi:phosphoribosylanthranilate isomerase
MPTRVKICGITRLEDAELAVELGAAALGFNFYQPSPRYIGLREARGIIEKLPVFVTAVGVFADETDYESVLLIARQARVSALQVDGLSGSLAPDLPELTERYSIIVTLRVTDGFKPESLTLVKGSGTFLLDASHPTLRGGTGRTFDWNLAREAKKYGRIILAGGLTPANVGEAIRTARPYAVDVASGVESSPGKKDLARLRAFFAAVEEADRTD